MPDLPARLTPRQAEVLALILPSVEAGLSGPQTARATGLSLAAIQYVLGCVFGSARWSPTSFRIRAALALPVSTLHKGHDRSLGSRVVPETLSPPDAPQPRASEAATARAAHEAFWLAEERRRYGPLPRSLPLSRQIA